MPAAERRLSSDGHKGGRKVVVAKRPGPAPAEPLKKRSKTDRKKAEVDRMRNKRERKLEDKQILGNKDSDDPTHGARSCRPSTYNFTYK